MRNKIATLLEQPLFVLAVLILITVLSYLYGALGYLIGLVVALLYYWASRFNGSKLGMGKPQWIKTIVRAVLFALGIFLLIDICRLA